MAVYLVADIDVHDAETYAEYSSRAQATFEGYGEVTYLVRGGEAEVLEGDFAGEAALIDLFSCKAACPRPRQPSEITGLTKVQQKPVPVSWLARHS